MTRSPRSIVAISEDRHRAELLDALSMDDDGWCDSIVVESVERGYSRVKQVYPDLVVVLIEIDDERACRLLTMLHADDDLSGVTVVTCATQRDGGEFEHFIHDIVNGVVPTDHALPLN
jgi:hypothetical protein